MRLNCLAWSAPCRLVKTSITHPPAEETQKYQNSSVNLHSDNFRWRVRFCSESLRRLKRLWCIHCPSLRVNENEDLDVIFLGYFTCTQKKWERGKGNLKNTISSIFRQIFTIMVLVRRNFQEIEIECALGSDAICVGEVMTGDWRKSNVQGLVKLWLEWGGKLIVIFQYKKILLLKFQTFWMKAGREGDRGGIGVRVRLEWIERMVLEWLLVI